jgi:hypothetical protein
MSDNQNITVNTGTGKMTKIMAKGKFIIFHINSECAKSFFCAEKPRLNKDMSSNEVDVHQIMMLGNDKLLVEYTIINKD